MIPTSSHGTNPASAILAGLKVIIVKNDINGKIDIHDFKEKVELHKDKLSCFMVTYPSTFGVFDDDIDEVI